MEKNGSKVDAKFLAASKEQRLRRKHLSGKLLGKKIRKLVMKEGIRVKKEDNVKKKR